MGDSIRNSHLWSTEEWNKHVERLITFRNWPISHPIPATTLALHGFKHAGFSDAITCTWCNMVLQDIAHINDVLHRLERNNPNCKRATAEIVSAADTSNRVIAEANGGPADEVGNTSSRPLVPAVPPVFSETAVSSEGMNAQGPMAHRNVTANSVVTTAAPATIGAQPASDVDSENEEVSQRSASLDEI